MRRIDAILIGVGLMLAGALVYGGLQLVGLNATDAGIWTQALLVVGLVGWLLTYLVRAMTQNMTYSQQLQEYKEAVLQKQLDALSPEELAALAARLEAEEAAKTDDRPES
jgi:sugar phosphate permease